MGLHSIVEPVGTLMMGWELVPEDNHGLIDPRNTDHARKADPAEGDRTPVRVAPSKWELSKVG